MKLGEAEKGLRKNITKQGRGFTTHYKPIPNDVLFKIIGLLAKYQKIMEVRKMKNYAAYHKALDELSPDVRDSYHKYLTYGAQFIITLFDCRRGREGLREINKDHYALTTVRKLDSIENVLH